MTTYIHVGGLVVLLADRVGVRHRCRFLRVATAMFGAMLSSSQQGSQKYSAGVLVHDGCGNVLLGCHRDGWTSFSGKCEPEDGGLPRRTAMRECREETLGVLGEEVLSASIADVPFLVSHTPSGRPFYLFEAVLPSSPDVSARFECTKASRLSVAPETIESTALRWFRSGELLHAHRCVGAGAATVGRAQRKRRRGVWLRPSFAADLQEILSSLPGSNDGQRRR